MKMKDSTLTTSMRFRGRVLPKSGVTSRGVSKVASRVFMGFAPGLVFGAALVSVSSEGTVLNVRGQTSSELAYHPTATPRV